jgi:uncharacterized protein (TIGR04255 family)
MGGLLAIGPRVSDIRVVGYKSEGHSLSRTREGDRMAVDGTDLFPASDRVFYEKAPLVEVIAQLRYPPILAIQASPPVAFQERIRDVFPLVQQESGLSLPAGLELPGQISQIIGANAGMSYKFLTEDNAESVTLTRDFLAYSTKKYRLWENFKETLHGPLAALVEIYRPSFYTRIGLRYIDAINREFLGISQTKFSELFEPPILGELSVSAFEENVETLIKRIVVKLPNGTGSVQLQHGLGNIVEHPGVSYMIDFDFYRSEKTEVANAEQILEQFHDFAGRAFRWCITKRLHDALQPRPI